MDVAALVKHLEAARHITDYAYVSAAALMAYDYFVTLELEIALVWPSAWNYTKILFLLTRYLPFAQSLLFLYNQVWLDVSPYTCYYTYPASAWLIVISMNIAEAILAIRAWAIWRQSKRIAVLLTILMAVGFAMQCYSMYHFRRALVFSAAPYRGHRGCFITETSSILLWNYLTLIIIEAVVLLLMLISATRAYIAREKSQLLQIVHRDGIMAYVYILCVSIANSLIIKLAPPYLIGLLSPMESIIYSVLTCRVVLHLLQQSELGQRLGMHTKNWPTHIGEDESVALSTVIRLTTTDQWG